MGQSENISFETLLDWVEGRLSSEEAARVARAVIEGHAATQATADWLRAFQEVSSEIVLVAPPQTLRRDLQRRFAAHHEARRDPQPAPS
jgi:anti-sigma-K factor RskA